ncbi:MAG: PAS domain-containing protein [Spirochaetales bacterium]|jgi:PAS domain S-box-containing protein|nr:PAS domain-containing protein [Spirochaetales bacterium]
MRDFIRRTLDKLEKLDQQQIHTIIYDLAHENERFEALIESTPDSLIVTDLQHRITLYNRAARKFLVSRFRTLHGHKVWTVIEDKDLAAHARSSVENHEAALNKEFHLEVGGELRILSCTIIPLAYKGRVLGDLFFMTDVTQARSQEARLRRAESLAALTTMTAGVAHEIKNPLGAIGIHIQLMKKALQGRDSIEPALILKNLNVVTEELERLNKIVVDFLFAVRPMNIKPQPSDLNAVIRGILDFVQVELSEARVSLEEKLGEGVPGVLLDEKAIKEAVLNIIQNAIVAMPQGGTLTVSTARKGEAVNLSIADTGVGITPENMGKIFEPYFTTRDFGSGLGLTNVYKIVKEHKAEISVDSQPGQGACFTISFPVPRGERRLLAYAEGEGSGE